MVTAEHAYDGVPKVPNGTYTCQRGWHQLHTGPRFETFEITGVEGHQGILFHVGNWPQIDSDGCLLCGNAIAQSAQGPMVTGSRGTFDRFMAAQEGVDSFELTVTG